MSLTADARALFTDRHATYARFIRAMRYPQGLRAFFRAWPALRDGLRVLDAGCGTGVVTLALHAGSISTTLARRIGQDLEQALGPAYGDFVAALERGRERIEQEVSDPEVRRTLFDRLVGSDLLEVIRAQGPTAADARIDGLLDGAVPPRRRQA